MSTPKVSVKLPKYPRIMVSGKRHATLASEAKKRNMSISAVSEEKFKIANAKKISDLK